MVGAGDGGGPEYAFAEGARRPLLGEAGVLGDVKPPVLFRVFATGRTGRVLDEVLFEARGLGKVVAMMSMV